MKNYIDYSTRLWQNTPPNVFFWSIYVNIHTVNAAAAAAAAADDDDDFDLLVML